jgi:hypothetical protein
MFCRSEEKRTDLFGDREMSFKCGSHYVTQNSANQITEDKNAMPKTA